MDNIFHMLFKYATVHLFKYIRIHKAASYMGTIHPWEMERKLKIVGSIHLNEIRWSLRFLKETNLEQSLCTSLFCCKLVYALTFSFCS